MPEKKAEERQRLADVTDDELGRELREAQQELFNLRVQQAGLQLTSPARVRQVRHKIARIKTIQRHRALSRA